MKARRLTALSRKPMLRWLSKSVPTPKLQPSPHFTLSLDPNRPSGTLAGQAETQNQEQSTMNIIITWIKDVETVASKIEQDLKAIEPSLSTDLTITSTVLTYAGPALQTVVTLEAGAAAGALVAEVIASAQQYIVAAKNAIALTQTATSAYGLLLTIQANLSTLLAEAKITSKTSVAIVTAIVNDLAAVVKALTPVAA